MQMKKKMYGLQAKFLLEHTLTPRIVDLLVRLYILLAPLSQQVYMSLEYFNQRGRAEDGKSCDLTLRCIATTPCCFNPYTAAAEG